MRRAGWKHKWLFYKTFVPTFPQLLTADSNIPREQGGSTKSHTSCSNLHFSSPMALNWYPKQNSLSRNKNTCIHILHGWLKQILLPPKKKGTKYVSSVTIFHNIILTIWKGQSTKIRYKFQKSDNKRLSIKSNLNPSQRATCCNFFRVAEVNWVISQSNT